MTWTPPRYLERLVVRTNEIHYLWDETDLTWVYRVPVNVDAKVAPWAVWVDAAICGLTIATIEWVVFRLAPLQRDHTPQDATEAAWCANIDRHYCEGLEFSRREWTGPIRSPLLSCFNIMHEAIFESKESGAKPLHCPALAAQLVEHLCKESYPAFLGWRQQVMERVAAFYNAPDPLFDLYGEVESRMVVPPQLFDLDVPFEMGDARRLVDEFLRSVDYRSNPFLLPPVRMIEDGFRGEPYRYV